jgi:putative glutamine amidotransferase
MVSAQDSDGVIEAVEIDPVRNPGKWVLAVQWHPEERLDDLRLFAAVVEAAAAYATGKVAVQGRREATAGRATA